MIPSFSRSGAPGVVRPLLILVLSLTAAGLASLLKVGSPANDRLYVTDARPELLDFDELLTLSTTAREDLPPALAVRLDNLLNTPFLNNEAYYSGARPFRPVEEGQGPTLRVVSWNIERGWRFELIRSALADGADFLQHLNEKDGDVDLDEETRRQVNAERRALQSADVLVLQEVDWGVRRSEYRAVVEELAAALQMNWTYGVEFLEVDPIQLGTETFDKIDDEDDRRRMRELTAVDRNRFKGLHGTAILSRYPIRSARLLPLKNQGYDWFAEELDGFSMLEGAKREATEELFNTPIGREIRHGGRTLLVAELVVEDLPEGVMTVAAAHLESRAPPDARQDQLEEVLGHLKDIGHPVVLAGDMNTSGQDGTPTNWKHEFFKRVGDGEFWTKTALKYVTGVGVVLDAAVSGLGFIRKSDDPTVAHVPVVAPNAEAGFFEMLEKFRFADGYAFDFRGDATRSANGRKGTLANSNQRDDKGFVVTYEVDRTVGPAGKLKLDWIFVKAYATDPRDKKGSYRFAPHRGRTMEDLNYAVTDRMSDHSPICVDLPLPASE